MDRRPFSAPAAALLVAVALSAAGPAAAATKPVATPEAVTGMMVVWSGANQREKAERQQADAQPLLELLGPYFEGGVVSPEIFESARVHGLKPGFFVVALGVCPQEEVGEVLGVFQAIYPDVYAKPVDYVPGDELPELGCPRLAIASEEGNNVPGRWRIDKSESRPVGAARLSAIVFTYTESTAGDFLREYAGVDAVFALTDPRKRTLLASAVFHGPSNWTKLKAFSQAGTGWDLQLDFADPPCDPGGADYFEGFEQTIAVRAGKGAISVRDGARKKLREGSCGYEEEARMISGPQDGEAGDEDPADDAEETGD